MLKAVIAITSTLLFTMQAAHADNRSSKSIIKIQGTSAEVLVAKSNSGKTAVVMCLIPQMLQSYMQGELEDIEVSERDIVFIEKIYTSYGISNNIRRSMMIIPGCSTQLSN